MSQPGNVSKIQIVVLGSLLKKKPIQYMTFSLIILQYSVLLTLLHDNSSFFK